MANQLDANVKDDLKTQFVTREGTYRLLTLSEYSRPNRVGYSSNQSSPQVRVSIVTLPNPGKVATEAGSPTGGTGSAGGATGTAGAATTTNGTSPASSPTGAATGGGGGNLSNGGAGGDNNYSNNNNNSSGGGGTSTVDARLGGGISMHSMMNGSVIDQNGVATNPIVGGDRICFNFGRDLYVYSFRGAKKVCPDDYVSLDVTCSLHPGDAMSAGETRRLISGI